MNLPKLRQTANAKLDADIAAVEREIAKTIALNTKSAAKSEAKLLAELVGQVLKGIALIPDAKLQAMLAKAVYASHLPMIKAEIARRAAGRKADAELVLALSAKAGAMATSTLERLVRENTGALHRVAKDELQRRAALHQ